MAKSSHVLDTFPIELISALRQMMIRDINKIKELISRTSHMSREADAILTLGIKTIPKIVLLLYFIAGFCVYFPLLAIFIYFFQARIFVNNIGFNNNSLLIIIIKIIHTCCASPGYVVKNIRIVISMNVSIQHQKK